MFRMSLLAISAILFILVGAASVFSTSLPDPFDPTQPSKTREMGEIVSSIKNNADKEKAIEVLINDLKNSSGIIRSHAARLLGDIGGNGKTKEALKILAEKDSNPDVRKAAAFNLFRVEVATAKDDKQKKDILLKDLKEGIDKIGRGGLWTVDQLGDLGIKEAITDLERLASKSYVQRDVQAQIRLAITKINIIDSTPTRIDAYKLALKNENGKIRVWSLEKMGELGDKAAIPLLQEEKRRIEDKYFSPPISGKRHPKLPLSGKESDDTNAYRAVVNSLKKMGLDLREGTPDGFVPGLYYIDDK